MIDVWLDLLIVTPKLWYIFVIAPTNTTTFAPTNLLLQTQFALLIDIQSNDPEIFQLHQPFQQWCRMTIHLLNWVYVDQWKLTQEVQAHKEQQDGQDDIPWSHFFIIFALYYYHTNNNRYSWTKQQDWQSNITLRSKPFPWCISKQLRWIYGVTRPAKSDQKPFSTQLDVFVSSRSTLQYLCGPQCLSLEARPFWLEVSS